MIEKYAVDPSQIPPTDDQLRSFKRLGAIIGVDYATPQTSKEAEELISEMEKEASDGR